jgi:uncharacterized protein YgiB involved in biofilm formation
MKRSSTINVERMRKCRKRFLVKPLTLAIAAATLSACDNTQEAKIYRDAAHCIEENPSLTEACEAAYQKAVSESSRSGPKYSSKSACADEFGSDNCTPYRGHDGQNWFIPAMAGFLFAKVLDRNDYQSSPLYTSYSRHSPVYNKWSTVDGDLFGSRNYGSKKVNSNVFKPKPTVTRTISRGGFGSTVTAKSRWGGSSRGGRGGGWGG